MSIKINVRQVFPAVYQKKNKSLSHFVTWHCTSKAPLSIGFTTTHRQESALLDLAVRAV